jgi:hypothetical protein
MGDLTSWLSETTAHPVVQAAIAHAWLTHIHPFEDGNGRMARLLANLTLARAGYPPVIVKASAHRTSYLDALAESDRGGNILPLVGVFSRLVKGTFRDVRGPAQAQRMWHRLLNSWQPSVFLRWQEETRFFLSVLSDDLAPDFAVARGDEPDAEDYVYVRAGRLLVAPRVATVTSPGDADFDLKIIVTPMSPRAASYAAPHRHPSLRFLAKTYDGRKRRAQREIRPCAEFPFSEVTITPEALPNIGLIGDVPPKGCGTKVAANIIAEQIRRWAARDQAMSPEEWLRVHDYSGRISNRRGGYHRFRSR